MTFRRIGRHFVFVLSACLLFVSAVFAQQDSERKTVAITYPLDETVTVKFRGTTLLPRLKGEAKVRRAGRRGTRVELSIDDLPRASELGGIYTTYILWAFLTLFAPRGWVPVVLLSGICVLIVQTAAYRKTKTHRLRR